jgi:hypothetical protein
MGQRRASAEAASHQSKAACNPNLIGLIPPIAALVLVRFPLLPLALIWLLPNKMMDPKLGRKCQTSDEICFRSEIRRRVLGSPIE